MLSAIKRVMGRFAACDRGTFAVYFGLAVLPLGGMTAAAVDYNRASNIRTQLQSAVDSAALAAVRMTTEAQRQATASAVFSANTSIITQDGRVRITQTSTSPDASRHKVRATAYVDTVLARVIGSSASLIGVSATAVIPTEQTGGGGCFYALDRGTNGALRINGGSQIDAPTCVAHVHSSIVHSFIINTNSRFMVERTCVRGTALLNSGYQTGLVEQGCTPDGDPMAGRVPVVNASGCTFNNLVFNPQPGPILLTPGSYCGNTIFNGGAAQVTFQPGLYIIKGPMIFNSGSIVRGTGVTFHFADQGTFMMNGQMQMYLDAPTSGTYSNLLMIQDPALPKRNFIFNNELGQKLSGVIWLPTQDIQFNSRSNGTDADSVTVIANTAILNAQARWRIAPSVAGTGPRRPTGAPRLDHDQLALGS
jgi:Flp pilus assembly protein TadG